MPDEFMVVSPEELASGRVLPSEMLRDLHAVAKSEPAAVKGFSHTLKQEASILSDDRLDEVVGQFFDDQATAESITRAVQNIRPESKQMILALVDRWRQSADNRRDILSDDDFAALQRNLDLLVQEYPALALMQKAQRLLRDTGNEIEDALVVCDLRPVFDRPQEQVEGFVALANLRIRYVRQSGERDVFEISLTENELSTLIEQCNKALQKLKVLKQTVPGLVQ